MRKKGNKRKVLSRQQQLHNDYDQAKWALVKALRDLKEYGLKVGHGEDFEAVQDAIKEVFNWTVVIL